MFRDRPLRTAYWLVVCVLLFYQQPASMALHALAVRAVTGEKASRTEDPLNGQCDDWEVYDGVDCVCATDKDAKCKGTSGMVCDDQGNHYKSKCYFALETCQQSISLKRSITSCGACKYLRLSGGKDQPGGSAIFKREGSDTGMSTRYRSTADRTLEVFFVQDSGTWAIGRTNSTGTFVAMIQMIKASYPQEGNPGMLVPRQGETNITWEFDDTYHIDCIDSTELRTREREKRFIFTLIFAITMAITAVTITLKVVQAVRGCLYYPSVCRMRDNIKNRLLPEVTRKKERFLSIYGDPGKFSTTVDEIHTQILDLKEKITTIRDLYTDFKFRLSSMVGLFKSLDQALPDLKSVLKDYDDWVSSASKSAELQIRLLPLEILMSMPMLLTTTVTSLALAASGIGLVFAFGFAIVDIVSSVTEERKVRDQLKTKENELYKARKNLDDAFRNMEEFQNKFCWHVLPFLYSLSEKGKPYHDTFRSLNDFISQTFENRENRCNNQNVISRINKENLVALKNQYITPVLDMLTNEEKELRLKIDEVKETNAFLDEIRNKILQKEHPVNLFRFIKTHKPILTNKNFGNLFDLLKLISKSILPQETCFWGYHLQNIRLGRVTVDNYLEAPICNSNELASLFSKITSAVQNQSPLCQIARQVQGSVFKTRYHVIRFIADYVLPGQDCYWGYDLSYIQGYGYDDEINTATIDSTTVQTLKVMEGAPLSIVRTIMNSKFSMKSDHMQNFVLCQLWKKKSVLNRLGCTIKSTSCFPSNDINTSC